MRTIIVCCALAAAAAACLEGCGPIWSAAIIVDATGKFRTAKEMDARQYAPYEYYAAEEYLHKAREKESYAQYEEAVDYGKLALAFSKQALEKAQLAKSGATPAAPHPGVQSIFGGQGAQPQGQPQYAPPTQPQYAPPTEPQYAPPAQPDYNYTVPQPPAPQQPTF